MRDTQGRIVGVMGISRDITERKRAESQLAELVAQLQQSRDDMRSILNALRLGTAMTDEEGRIMFLSQTAQRLFGKNPENVLGRPWTQACPFQKQDMAQLQVMAERSPHQRAKVPVHLETPGGRYYWVEIDVQDDPRNPRRKIFFFYDVSEVQDLRRLLEEKGQFQDLIGKSVPMQRVYRTDPRGGARGRDGPN